MSDRVIFLLKIIVAMLGIVPSIGAIMIVDSISKEPNGDMLYVGATLAALVLIILIHLIRYSLFSSTSAVSVSVCFLIAFASSLVVAAIVIVCLIITGH